MISVDLSGNISDHLIRYAICRTVAEKNNFMWGINPVTSHDYYQGKEQMFFFEDINYGVPIDTLFGQLPIGVSNIWEEKYNSYQTHDFYPFQDNVFDIPDNTKIVLRCGQDARYLEKDKIKKWLRIKPEYQIMSNQILQENHIELDEDLCVLNARGGEYIGVSYLFLGKKYWDDAMRHMKSINSNMRFIVVTEHPEFYRSFFDLPVYHFNIFCDYFIIHNAKNLILSNSGFGLFPAWTNDKVDNVIAPMHWARHNLGVWANSSVWTFGNEKWKWLDSDGVTHVCQ